MANTKITTAVIKDDAITTAKIADDAVTGALIADDVALAGNPTTTTQSAGNNTTRIATTAFVTTAINNLVDSAPSALDTLNELAAAMGDDANFSTTVTNSIATKLPLAGGTMTGDLVAPNIKATTEFQIFSGGTDIGAIFNSGGALTIQGTSTRDVSIGSDSVTNAIFVEGTNGNVCIGSSTTDGTLHVESGSAGTITSAAAANELVLESDGPVGMSLLFDDEANDAYGNIYWGNETDGNADGRITYFGSTYVTAADRQSMVFRTAGTERMRIDSSGNVAIAQSPSGSHKLEVTQVGGDGINVNSGADFGGIRLTDNSHSYAMRNASNMFFIYDVTNTTQRVTLNDSGQFGIGTANMHLYDTDSAGVSADLVVASAGHAGIVVASGTSSDAGIFFGDGGGAASYRGAVSYVNSQDALYFKANGANKLILESDGDLNLQDGNLVVASGHGIDFSATADSSGTMTSELLDDYEEGSFTAGLLGQTTAGSFNYTLQQGRYVKIGQAVTVQITIYYASRNTAPAGNLVITGLPFSANTNNTQHAFNVGWAQYITFPSGTSQIGAYLGGGGTTLILRGITSGGSGGVVQGSDTSTTLYLMVSGTYYV